MVLQDLIRRATPADLGSVKAAASSLQSATLLMPPALLFKKVEHKNITLQLGLQCRAGWT